MIANVGGESPSRPRKGRSAANQKRGKLKKSQFNYEKCTVIGRVAELLKISRPKARKSVQTVLCTVRDRLPHDVLVPFGGQLPPFARHLYFEDWESANAPITTSLWLFVEDIQQNLPDVCIADPFSAIRAVLIAVREHIGKPNMANIKQAFALEMHGLFDASPASVHPCTP